MVAWCPRMVDGFISIKQFRGNRVLYIVLCFLDGEGDIFSYRRLSWMSHGPCENDSNHLLTAAA